MISGLVFKLFSDKNYLIRNQDIKLPEKISFQTSALGLANKTFHTHICERHRNVANFEKIPEKAFRFQYFTSDVASPKFCRDQKL